MNFAKAFRFLRSWLARRGVKTGYVELPPGSGVRFKCVELDGIKFVADRWIRAWWQTNSENPLLPVLYVVDSNIGITNQIHWERLRKGESGNAVFGGGYVFHVDTKTVAEYLRVNMKTVST